ncbi:MAG: M14 family metallopeptidase [Armatimonadota bacterium]
MAGIPDLKFDSYYTYDELVDFLRGCDDAAGDCMTLESIAETPEGRDVWLATLTDPEAGAPEEKPGYWVQANVHAPELAGTTAALRWLHTLLTAQRDRLAEGTFYVVPRANPDGAEFAITTLGPIRSRFEIEEKRNGLIPQDINDDGKITNMRWEDPAGAYALHPDDPRVMMPRKPGDEGPFYQQYTEGRIHDYDGGEIVGATTGYDFNRHYPANWSPDMDNADYPLKHPEIRGIAQYLLSHHNIFAGIDFHNGTQAVLRPSTRPDSEMNQEDLTLMTQIGRIGEDITGFPLMNARDYRSPWIQPRVLHGNSNDFAYFELGVSWYVVELGNTFSSAGVSSEEYFEITEEERYRELMPRVLKFVDEHPDHIWTYDEWEEIDHPELGKVEVGGFTYGNVIMPYPPHQEQNTKNTTEFLLEHSRWHPQIVLSDVSVARIDGDVYRVRAKVSNVGRTATNIMSTGTNPRIAEPVRLRLECGDDVEVVSRTDECDFGQLSGGSDSREHEWFVVGSAGAEICITAAHPRGGTAAEKLSLE